ncbi:MAG: 3-methyl-2-oxobutanoate dehydrogenase subunit VorB [Candidatus Delongbacteria bacterium]
MSKILMKGNDAVLRAAILAGCRQYFGYPITPASEIAESAAYYMPRAGGTFIQAESEVAAINMVYGAAGAGGRVLTASSSPGISLKQEGVSYAAGAELPCVIINVNRAGPGLGNIAPEQSDYNQLCKGGGHGNYKTPVLAPNCVQEFVDLVRKAFELAEDYRTPVYLLADGVIGQMMEPVEFPEPVMELPRKDWALYADKESKHNLISSIQLEPNDLEALNVHLQEKYARLQAKEVMVEEYRTEDAEYVFTGFGIVSRILRSAVDELRKQGLKVGLIRPISLVPFPEKELAALADRVKSFLCVELNNGQMLQDVKLAIQCRRPVHFYNRMGGNIPTTDEVVQAALSCFKEA